MISLDMPAWNNKNLRRQPKSSGVFVALIGVSLISAKFGRDQMILCSNAMINREPAQSANTKG
jgi:hypothetical protein